MNEDIKILESECHYLEELGYLRENNHFIRFNQALENLIKRYRELEEEIERQKEINTIINKENLDDKYEEALEKVMTKFLNNNIENDYIPKSLVEENIKELKQEGNYKTLENPDGRVHFQAEPCDYKIQVLEELLGKEK